MRDCSLAVCVQSASVAFVIGLLICARIGDQRQRYFVTGCPGPTRRPASQTAQLPTIAANEQRDDEVPEASAVSDAAVAAYRLSVQAGNPHSERRLAQMFGRTSRR